MRFAIVKRGRVENVILLDSAVESEYRRRTRAELVRSESLNIGGRWPPPKPRRKRTRKGRRRGA